MANVDSVMMAHEAFGPNSHLDKMEYLHEKYVNIINFHRKHSSKNKAILSFKYDELTLRVNIIQIVIIFFSTGISFLESVKNYFILNEQIFNVITIVLSTSIALIMAIYRFLKYEEEKETVKNAIQDHVFIINKFRKIYSQLENIKDKPDYLEKFNKIIDNFENETFDNYISIRENFDTIFSFNDSIYYKNKYKNNLLKLEKINNEIELIDDYKRDDIIYKTKSNCISYLFCCKKPEIDYDVFIENGKKKKQDEKEEREKSEMKSKKDLERLLQIDNENLKSRTNMIEQILYELQTDLDRQRMVNGNNMRTEVFASIKPPVEAVSEYHNNPNRVIHVYGDDYEQPNIINPDDIEVHVPESRTTTASPSPSVTSTTSIPVDNNISKVEYERQIDSLNAHIQCLRLELDKLNNMKNSELNTLKIRVEEYYRKKEFVEKRNKELVDHLRNLQEQNRDAYERCAAAEPIYDQSEKLNAKLRAVDCELRDTKDALASLTCELNKSQALLAEREDIIAQLEYELDALKNKNSLKNKNYILEINELDPNSISDGDTSPVSFV